MDMLLVLPILIPLSTAVLMLFVWQHTSIQRWLDVVGTAMLFGSGLIIFGLVSRDGIQALQIGRWPAPFGITLAADLFSAIVLSLIGLIGLIIAIYGLAALDERHRRTGYHPIAQILLLSLVGTVLTGDIFNLFVWFEVMLISSFVLLTLGGGRDQIEGAYKYVALNLFASSLFLAAVGILYGVTGTLNMGDLAMRFSNGVVEPGLIATLAVLFLVALGIKSAVFPLFFWLPASYHTAPPVISALFAGLLTKVGVFVMIRLFSLLFMQETGYTQTLLLWIAGLTMVIGVLGAAAQNDIRRILSFHIVSQIGYMIMGLAIFTPLALAGAIFFLAHNIIVKTNLFLISGVIARVQGTEKLKQLGGLYRAWPALTALFLISALALAGLPPFSGFWAKLMLVQAGLSAEAWIIVAASLVVSVLTLYSMTKIWNEAFWKENSADFLYQQEGKLLSRGAAWSMIAPITILAVLAITMGIVIEPLAELSQSAAAQLLDSSAYVEAVMGAIPVAAATQ